MLLEIEQKPMDSFAKNSMTEICKRARLQGFVEIPVAPKRELIKINRLKPWLQTNGMPLCDSLLKRESRGWSAKTWESYLRWYDRPRKEALIHPASYEEICDARSEPIYGEFGYDVDDWLRDYCGRLLNSLPPFDGQVLRLYFLEGLTELQTGIRLKRKRQDVHYTKNKALSRLRRENPAEIFCAIRIMRGPCSSFDDGEPSFGVSLSKDPIRENRNYRPQRWGAEIVAIKNSPVRKALMELSPNQQQIVYLRFWCDRSIATIAHSLGIGINVTQDICDAAVTRIKRRVVDLSNITKGASV